MRNGLQRRNVHCTRMSPARLVPFRMPFQILFLLRATLLSSAMQKSHAGRQIANKRTMYSWLLGNFSKVQHRLLLWPRLIPFIYSISNRESFSNHVYLHSYNIEFSCPAERSHVLQVLRTTLALPDKAQGVNCNDLLGNSRFKHKLHRVVLTLAAEGLFWIGSIAALLLLVSETRPR